MGHEFVDESTRATLAYVNKVVDDARERWRDAVGAEMLEERLDRLREVLLTHPVAMEYVARAMPRATPVETKDTRSAQTGEVEKVSGE